MEIMQINNLKKLEIKNKLQTNSRQNFYRAFDLVLQPPSEDVVENSNSISFQSKKITKKDIFS